MAVQSLTVTGIRVQGGFKLHVDDVQVPLTPMPLQVLLELMTVLYDGDGWLSARDLKTAWGRKDLVPKQMERLRDSLRNRSLIINRRPGFYRLNLLPEQIRLDDSLWRISADEVPSDVLRDLKAAYDKWRRSPLSNGSAFDVSELSAT